MPRKEEEMLLLNWIYIYICIYTLDCYPLKLTRISYFGGRSICGSLDCDIGSVT